MPEPVAGLSGVLQLVCWRTVKDAYPQRGPAQRLPLETLLRRCLIEEHGIPALETAFLLGGLEAMAAAALITLPAPPCPAEQ